MDVTVLIDAIVRQTTVLIAQLATTTGVRAPLAHIANQIFLDLVGELESQGVGRKVIADMFGLALRSYQQKVRRLSESATHRGMTLWEAVYRFLQQEEVVLRSRVMERFRHDNEASVRGILNDMVESGLIYKTGRGEGTMYRVTSDEELSQASMARHKEATCTLVWVAVYRHAPLSFEALREVVPLGDGVLTEALESLQADGRITAAEEDGAVVYDSKEFMVQLGDNAGWEASVFDHYQAVVAAICTKLRNGKTRALPDDRLGGSTFSYDIWPGHPMEDRVHGMLSRTRESAIEVWEEVMAYNTEHPPPEDAERVVFYVGQSVKVEEEEGEDDA